VSWKAKIKYLFAKIIGFLNNLFKVTSLINMIMFFVSHAKRNVAERILGINMERIDPNQRRYVDFTYINRLIVWNALG